MEKDSKILVTGASGMIGSALVRLLKAQGYENIVTERIDLIEQEAVQNYFYNVSPNYVFHLAGHVGGIAQNHSESADFIYYNTIMQCNVFEAARELGVKKLLFPGSACAYPAKALQPIKEQDFLHGKPESTNLAYALAKQNGIVMAQSYAKQYGMKVVLPMIANTYGPNDRSTHVIPDMIRKFRAAKDTITLWGSGMVRREFIHADDVAFALLFLMKNYDFPEIINVGTMEEIQIRTLAYKIAEICGYDGKINFDTSKPEGVKRKVLDSTRLYNLGWRPKIKLDDGLHEVIGL